MRRQIGSNLYEVINIHHNSSLFTCFQPNIPVYQIKNKINGTHKTDTPLKRKVNPVICDSVLQGFYTALIFLFELSIHFKCTNKHVL